MSFLISLALLVLVLIAALFLLARVSSVLRFLAGLAVFCVAVAFLIPIRRQYSIVFPSPVEEAVSAVERIALYGVNPLADVLRFLAGILGLS